MIITLFCKCSSNTSQMLTFSLGYSNNRQRYKLESQVIYGIYGPGRNFEIIQSGLYPKFRSQNISDFTITDVGKKL
jgi:hypothetical protein